MSPYQTHCKQKPLSSSGDHAPTECLTLGQSKTRTILNILLAYSKTCKKRKFLPTNPRRRTLKLLLKMPLKVIAAKFNGANCNFRSPDFAIFTDDFKLLSRLAPKTGPELMCARSDLIFTLNSNRAENFLCFGI